MSRKLWMPLVIAGAVLTVLGLCLWNAPVMLAGLICVTAALPSVLREAEAALRARRERTGRLTEREKKIRAIREDPELSEEEKEEDIQDIKSASARKIFFVAAAGIWLAVICVLIFGENSPVTLTVLGIGMVCLLAGAVYLFCAGRGRRTEEEEEQEE